MSATNGALPKAAHERERRAAPRWGPAVRCPARMRVGAVVIDADVADLSARGARVVIAADAGGTKALAGVAIEIELDLGPRTYRRRARVAWFQVGTNGQSGAGIEYEHDDDDALPALDVRAVKIDPALALRVPASLALRRRVLPLCQVDGEVHVACADLRDVDAVRALERYFDVPLRAQQADPESMVAVLRRVYGDGRAAREGAADDPVALCNELLYAAWLRRASDVHIDPERDGVRVRLRVDGELEEYRRLEGRAASGELLSRIKVLGGMDIAEKRAPQDGRFTQEFGGGEAIDIRVATLPTRHGERATLRFLAIDTESLTLENLGMSSTDLAVCEIAVARPHGLVLTTGPTGCGKTTTLYAALRRVLAQRSVNAIAVQDPVEYDIPGVAQVEVDSAQKITFGKALRSILRHDPDVIMIGEIRDQETADIAIKAALTGHLVLATLHTNSAASAVTRLVDMGADRYLVAATLRLSVSQRLVRRLCPYCRVPAELDARTARALGRPEAAGMQVHEARGCVYCAGRGYSGRSGVFELLAVDDELAQAIDDGASEVELVRRARAQGVATIQDDALAKLAEGTTSLREALAAVAT
ncbi:MAG: GspE/PulE family protein [Planctomycetota bacterium]